jgi:hypothetical protein
MREGSVMTEWDATWLHGYGRSGFQWAASLGEKIGTRASGVVLDAGATGSAEVLAAVGGAAEFWSEI